MGFAVHIFLGFVFFAVCCLGVFGNGIVLIVLLREPGPWSVSTTYLFNLAVADLLFVSFLPFWGHYQFNELTWVFGAGMCKFSGALTYINMYASIFFLTAMSLDRWAAIVRATKPNRCRRSGVVRWICVGIWVASVSLCIPSFLYRTLRPKHYFFEAESSNSSTTPATEAQNVNKTTELGPYSCALYIPDTNLNKLKIMGALELLRTIIGFLLPFTIICSCYISILITVKRKVIGAKHKKDRVAKLAATIIAAFFVCWMPYHCLNVYSALGGWLSLFPVNGPFYVAVKPFFVSLAYTNSCINPLLYAFTTGNFQDSMKALFFGHHANRRAENHRTTIKEEKHCKTQVTGFNTPRNSPIIERGFNSPVAADSNQVNFWQ